MDAGLSPEQGGKPDQTSVTASGIESGQFDQPHCSGSGAR
jgi:hypothetical protein